jgi:hypothetical protein
MSLAIWEKNFFLKQRIIYINRWEINFSKIAGKFACDSLPFKG